MNDRCEGCFAPKRKPGLHITGARIHARHIHRVSPCYGKGGDTGSCHFQRPRGRGCNVVGNPGSRTTNYKGTYNRSSFQQEKEVPISPIPSERVISERVRSPTRTAPKNDSVNEKPSTFICEGIEVDFESSDSEEEVRALKVVKVLKKSSTTNGCSIHICSADDDNRRPKIIPWVNGKVLRKQDFGERQVPLRITPAAVVVPQTSVRPSYVILSGLRKRTPTTGVISNCAIIKRPRFLFSQQVRPSTNRSTHPLLPFPHFQENAHFSFKKGTDLNLQEMRIIDDVLDMMEEVEMRASYANFS